MKKFILLFIVLVALLCIVGCSDDKNSPAGLDLSADDAYENLDYYIAIMGYSDYIGISVLTNKEVFSCELTINKADIPISEEWLDVSEFLEDFTYGNLIEGDMLEELLEIEAGLVLDIQLKINGFSYKKALIMPHIPEVAEKEFDISSDFNFSWTLGADPMLQLVGVGAEEANNAENGSFYITKQTTGETRSITFSKSEFPEFSTPDLEWYQYGVDAVNYKDFGKTMFLLTTNDYFGYESEERSTEHFRHLNRIIKGLNN